MSWASTLVAPLDEAESLVRVAEPIPPAARWPYRVTIEAGTARAELAFLTGASPDRLAYSIDRGILGSDAFNHPLGSAISRSYPTTTDGAAAEHPGLPAHVALGLAGTTHGHVDADIPAGIARDAEVAAAIAAHLAAANHATAVASGIIVMWGGLVANIPSGWLLCDGQNGTPDLRDRFIKGASGTPGATGGAATHGHAVTQPTDHAAVNHAGAAVGNHTVTQPGAHSDHVFTQPGNHSVTQPGAHSAHAVTQPSAHADHAVQAHSAHAGGAVDAHAVTQPSAHVVTQPGAHAAHAALGTHAHELPFTKLAGGTGALRMLAQSIFGSGTSRAPESVSAAPTANTTAATVALSQAVTAGTPDAHSAHAGAAVDAHSGTAVAAHAFTQPSAHSDHPTLSHGTHAGAAVDAHSAHLGAAVDAHAGGAVNAHSSHAGAGVDAHVVTQPSQHAAQSHAGAAVNTVNSEPAYYALCFIQKV